MYTIDDMCSELSKLGYPDESRIAAIEVTKRLMNVPENKRSEVFWSLVHRFALLSSPWWRDFFKNDVCFGEVSRSWDLKNGK